MRFRVAAPAALAVFGLALSGCQSAPVKADLGCVATELNRASKDAGELWGLLAGSRAGLLATNLPKLAEVEFAPSEAGLDVKWLASEGSQPAWHELGIEAQGCLVTNIFVPEGKPAPIWYAQEVEVYRQGSATVLAAGRDATGNAVDNQGWVSAASQAVDRVRARFPDWDGQLVVQVCDSPESFHLVSAGSAQDAAWAYTRAQDYSGQVGEAASHVTVNPTHEHPDKPYLLTHEAVHVAMSKHGVPEPEKLWISEGLAEAIALSVSPQRAAKSAQLVAENGLRAENPPTKGELDSADPQVSSLAYARSAALVAPALESPDLLGELRKLGWP